MKRVYVNEEVCLGCHLCEYECAFSGSGEDTRTGKPNSMFKAFSRKDKPLARIRVEEGGAGHGEDAINFAVSCRHCETPLCVKGCITGALSIDDGIITIDHDRCVGCRTCILMCPYGCLVINHNKTMLKCELCTETDHEPACVLGCPNQAIVFEERI